MAHLDKHRGNDQCPACEAEGFPRRCGACEGGLLHCTSVARGESGRTYLTVSCDVCPHHYQGVMGGADRLIDRATPVILVVDDEIDITDLLEYSLSGGGFTVYTANSGAEALSVAAETHPDLIVLDLDMPRMTGIEVLRRLKADPDLAGIPVVVLTGLSNPEIRRVAFKVGAVDYIEKPFTAPVVHRQLRRMTYKLGLTEPSEV